MEVCNISLFIRPTGSFFIDIKYQLHNQEQLKVDILSKNPEIRKHVEDNKTFDILFIQETNQSTNRAVIKIDPVILNFLNHTKDHKKTNSVVFVRN